MEDDDHEERSSLRRWIARELASTEVWSDFRVAANASRVA